LDLNWLISGKKRNKSKKNQTIEKKSNLL
jgi:hypothetical protein